MDQIRLHALVVGGTGMLKGVCQFLVQQGYCISVVARRTETLNALAREINRPDAVNVIPLDWNDSVALHDALKTAIQTFERISLTVAWIHSTASQAPLVVAKLVEGDFFHVRPRSVLEADYHDPVNVEEITALNHITYHQIVLGSINEGGYFRWLTNEEISNGVIEALQKHQLKFIVGE